MDHAIYHNLKKEVKNYADGLHQQHPTDKPLIRECLNNVLDGFIRNDLEKCELKEILSKERVALYTEWLTNYTILRHES